MKIPWGYRFRLLAMQNQTSRSSAIYSLASLGCRLFEAATQAKRDSSRVALQVSWTGTGDEHRRGGAEKVQNSLGRRRRKDRLGHVQLLSETTLPAKIRGRCRR